MSKTINLSRDGTELLEAIKTVDGDGSGLDADTLDGRHASSFALVSSIGTDNIESLPNGVYVVAAQPQRPADFPFDAFDLVSVKRSDNYQYQIAFSEDTTTPIIKIRHKSNGHWYPWYPIDPSALQQENVSITWNTEYVRSVTYEARMIGDMAVIRAMFTTTKEVPADAVICTLDRPFLRRHDLMVTGVNGTGSYVRLLLGYPPNQTIIVNTYPIPANLPCIMQTCGGGII